MTADDKCSNDIVRLANITVRFSERTILEGISLAIKHNETVSLVGPTGCGKTTLLNIIAGFLQPTVGSVHIMDKPVSGPGPDRGFVFQQPNLFPWLTVKENIKFGAKHGRNLSSTTESHRDLDDKADRYLSWAGLSDAKELYPYQISGGMKARAALGRVLLTDPPILLMDEPFSALDALTRAVMHKFILRLSKLEKRTIVLITHDVEEAILLSNRVFVMSIGPAIIAREFRVPFSDDRDYDEVTRSPELTRLKAEILDEITPYLAETSKPTPEAGNAKQTMSLRRRSYLHRLRELLPF